MGVEMKNILIMASMIMFVFAAQGFGFAFGAEQAAANDSINASQMNETLNNTTLINETLENASLSQNESDPFTNAKNRKPSSR